MAEKKEYKVQAQLRSGRGKNDARRTRRDGMVPITVYGGGGETVAAVAPLRDDACQLDKIKVLSIAPLLAKAIKSIHEETSVSSLFV